MKNKMRIDIEEVACTILGLEYEDYEEADDCTEQIMNIDLDTLEQIISKLLPTIDVGKSPLTGNLYKGFSRKLIKGSYIVKKWIAQTQIDEMQIDK